MRSILFILLLACIFSIGVFVGGKENNNDLRDQSIVIHSEAESEPELVDKEAIIKEVQADETPQKQDGNVFLIADKAAAASSWVFDQFIYGTQALIETINSSKSTS